MSYIVLMRFADLQDGNRVYEAGDTYPRPGFDVSPERLAELAGSDNRMGEPLIVDVDTPCEACTVGDSEKPIGASEDSDKGFIDQEPKSSQKSRRSRQKG